MAEYLLFLDDIRQPADVYKYTGITLFIFKDWEVVKNFEAFKTHIENNGLPQFVSFDHDLADSHYAPPHLWNDYDKSKKWQDKQVHEEKTGYECARWLVEYCMINNKRLPQYYVHSMNPVGKDKILGLLNDFKTHQIQKSNERI
jgi:hypothetical protein